jgi:endonuclease V-like protein UPF0215 family
MNGLSHMGGKAAGRGSTPSRALHQKQNTRKPERRGAKRISEDNTGGGKDNPMLHFEKKGIRILGIAESYRGREESLICGIVMRRDRIIDGCSFSRATVGGMDATDGILAIWHQLARDDIQAIMLGGTVISWFNVINIRQVQEATGVPVISVTYEDSPGLEDDIRYHFPGDEERLSAYIALGKRIPCELSTGVTVYLRAEGISLDDAVHACNIFTAQGKIPEPVRVARIVARGLLPEHPGNPDNPEHPDQIS